MFSASGTRKSLPQLCKFLSPFQPRSMHTIARAKNVAAPNAIQAHPDVARRFFSQSFHPIGERNR